MDSKSPNTNIQQGTPPLGFDGKNEEKSDNRKQSRNALLFSEKLFRDVHVTQHWLWQHFHVQIAAGVGSRHKKAGIIRCIFHESSHDFLAIT